MATSAGYTATATGTDYWVATYNGDSNNNAVTSGTAAEPVTITPASPTINTSQQPATATVGTSIADKATVSGGFNPTGTVTFNLYNNSKATGTPLFTDTETLSGGVATSKGYTATATGTDYWVATYNGDSNNHAVTSGTAAEPVTITPASPTINTQQLPAIAIVGTSIMDKATVSGGFNPTGTVTFNLYNNPNGTGSPLFTNTVPLSSGMATSAGYTATATGTDYWVATYNGNINNGKVSSGTASEPVTIAPAKPQLAAGSNSGAGVGLTELLDPPGSLQAGQISFAVALPQGQQAPAVQAAIGNAVTTLNAEVAPLGLSLVQVSSADAGSAQVHISFASTSAIGGVNQGVMGAYTSDGQITLINGWNWYFGSDAKGIAPDQYDFQTVLNHELGHVLGLGENSDPSSVMSLYLSPGQVRRDLTANDLDAIQQELQSSPAPLPASSAAAASGDALAVATASPSPVMTAASGLEPAAADPQGFSVPANSIRPDTVPPVVPGLETLGDSQELQAGPSLLPASPAAAAFGDALLVATASPSPVTAAVPQDFGVAANSTTLAPWPPVVPGLEIVENRGMADRLYDFALAALTGAPFGSSAANGFQIDLGDGVPHTGPDYLLTGDHAPTPAAPVVRAVIPVAPRPWRSAPGMTDPVPDAVAPVLIQDGRDPEGALEQADERAESNEPNATTVVMGVLALAWRWRIHLGRQDNDRDRRRRDPQRWLPGLGLGINQANDRK